MIWVVSEPVLNGRIIIAAKEFLETVNCDAANSIGQFGIQFEATDFQS